MRRVLRACVCEVCVFSSGRSRPFSFLLGGSHFHTTEKRHCKTNVGGHKHMMISLGMRSHNKRVKLWAPLIIVGK